MSATVEQVLGWMLSRYWYPVTEDEDHDLARLVARGTPVTVAEIASIEPAGEDRVWAMLHRSLFTPSRLRRVACDLAEHVLPIFERFRPGDARPRQALAIARTFARGRATDEARAMACRGAEGAASAATEAAPHWAALAVVQALEVDPDPWEVSTRAAMAASYNASHEIETNEHVDDPHGDVAWPAARELGRRAERDWQVAFLHAFHTARPENVPSLPLRELLIWLMARHRSPSGEQAAVLREKMAGRATLSAKEILELELSMPDRIWAVLRREFLDDRLLWELACDFAEHVLPIFEAAVSRDHYPRECIRIARRYARGEATLEERDLATAAARDAEWGYGLKIASVSGWGGHLNAARAAAWTVLREDPRLAAWTAAEDASWAAFQAASAAAPDMETALLARERARRDELEFQLDRIRACLSD